MDVDLAVAKKALAALRERRTLRPEHLGIVDKFIGDAVMAFWGPPFVSPTEHASLACRSALAQIAALNVLRAELPELTGLRRDAPGIDLRIGLASTEGWSAIPPLPSFIKSRPARAGICRGRCPGTYFFHSWLHPFDQHPPQAA